MPRNAKEYSQIEIAVKTHFKNFIPTILKPRFTFFFNDLSTMTPSSIY